MAGQRWYKFEDIWSLAISVSCRVAKVEDVPEGVDRKQVHTHPKAGTWMWLSEAQGGGQRWGFTIPAFLSRNCQVGLAMRIGFDDRREQLAYELQRKSEEKPFGLTMTKGKTAFVNRLRVLPDKELPKGVFEPVYLKCPWEEFYRSRLAVIRRGRVVIVTAEKICCKESQRIVERCG
ncbi:hypothetical protein HQ544_03025 [Candidatus Falkowbacteria bacterium]|nr:hypothetical protein [Candidatus Falkowbacteria bacterium]